MGTTLQYDENAERPICKLWWFDDAGSLIDFSSGYTFTFKVGDPGQTALLTKTSNIAGAAGSGTEPTGTPNVTITWTAGELAIAPGSYSWTLTASTSGLDRVARGRFQVLDAIN